MKTMHEYMRLIRDLAETDTLPAHLYGERLAQIREAANKALIETDGLEDRRGDVWGEALRNDQVVQARKEHTRAMLRGVTKRLKAKVKKD